MRSLEALPFRLLVDAVMEPARRHFRSMFLAVALPLGAMALVAGAVQVRWFQVVESEELGSELFVALGALLVVSFAFLGVYYLCYAVMVVAAQDAVAGRGAHMGRAWRFVLRPRNLLTLLLVAVLSLLSFLACGLPALYVIPLLSFALPVMTEEGLAGRRALGRSLELARYNPRGRFSEQPWVQMLGILFISWVISSAVATLVQLPFVALQQFLTMRQALEGGGAVMPAGAMWLQVPANFLGALATTVSWVYLAFGIAVLYREVRRRREGSDLEAAVEELLAGSSGPGGEVPAEGPS